MLTQGDAVFIFMGESYRQRSKYILINLPPINSTAMFDEGEIVKKEKFFLTLTDKKWPQGDQILWP